MPGSPTVTVITRTKDRILLLDRVVATLESQTFRDFEWVVVNDGGDPRELDDLLAKRKGQLPSRVTRIDNADPCGRAVAANQGVDAAAGEFVVLLDDDDSWREDFLSATVQSLRTHPDSVAAVARTAVVLEQINEDTNVVEEVDRFDFAPDQQTVSLTSLLAQNSIPPVSILFRHDSALHVGAFDRELNVLEDWDFFVRLSVQGPFRLLDWPARAFWHWRQDTNGALGNSIFVEKRAHRNTVDAVRDKHLRRALQNGGSLGTPLLIGAAIQDLQSFARTDFARLADTTSSNQDDAREWRSKLDQRLIGIEESLAKLRETNERLLRIEESLAKMQETNDSIQLQIDSIYESHLNRLARRIRGWFRRRQPR